MPRLRFSLLLSLCLACGLALPAEVQAQAKPGGQADVAAQAKGAKALSRALGKAFADGSLAKNVFPTRIYKIVERGWTRLIKVRGRRVGKGFELRLTFEELDEGEGPSKTATWVYDKAGRLRSVRFLEQMGSKTRLRKSKRTGRTKLEISQLQNGKPVGKKRTVEINPSSVPVYALLFFVPQLHASLPKRFQVAAGAEFDLARASKNPRTAKLKVRRLPVEVKGGRVYETLLSFGTGPIRLRVAAGGTHANKLVEIVSMVKSGPPPLRCVLISPALAKKLKAKHKARRIPGKSD